MKPISREVKHCILGFLLCGIWLDAHAQGSAFTYQGRLNDGGGPASGIYDLRFTIHDLASGGSAVAGPLTNTAVVVSNGLFAVTLEFDAGVFSGAERWLEIGVRTNGGDAFVALNPRQQITATPYAITARNVTGVVPGGGLSGTYSNAVTFDNAGNSFTGSGAGLSGVNAATLGGLNVNQFWKTSGNAGTTAANFLGTLDNQPLELRVNGQKALRLQPNAFGGPSVICGSNTVHAFSPAATIAGGQGNDIRDGGYYSTIGGGKDNVLENNAQQVVIAGGIENRMGAEANSSAIGGGWQNVMDASVALSVIAGGHTNFMGTLVQFGAIGGGEQNSIQTRANYSTIGGGRLNTIQPTNDNATIAGGGFNRIESGSHNATISGGAANVVSSNAYSAMIPGGYGNFAGGWLSFAAGNQAWANHDGAFVWADNQPTNFASTAPNQFSVRASGGVRFVTSGAGLSVDGNVGVGTTNPQSLLNVNGTLQWGGTTADYVYSGEDAGGVFLEQVGSSAAKSGIRFQTSKSGDFNNYSQFLMNPADGFSFLTLGTGNGNVGIGTITPQSKLEVRGNIRLGASGELHATSGQENLRIIRGEVAGNGIIVKGSGFTVAQPFVGIYDITFTTPFADRPTVTATADSAGGATFAVMVTDGASAGSARLQARNVDAFAYVATRFNFIAIGPR